MSARASASASVAAPPLAEPSVRPVSAPGAHPSGAHPAVAAPQADRSGSHPHSKLWMSVLGLVSVVVLVGVCGVAGFLLINGQRAGSAGASGGAKGSPSPTPRDISSQQVDAAPLTVAEVFPAKTIATSPTAKPYTVVKTQVVNDCKTGLTGDLVTLFSTGGCTQLVRGTLTSPDNAYVLTSGIFNMRDQTSAETVRGSVKPVIDAQKGRFTGLSAGGATDVIVRSATQLAWDFRGHFLVYCVIARADGKAISQTGDTDQLINDIVETYMKGKVIQARTAPVTASPAGSGGASTKPATSTKPTASAR